MDNKNKTRFCEKCGNQIKNGDRFCEHCGAEIKPLPMTSVNEKSTDIKLDKKSKKKLVVIISVVSAIAIVLAVCAIVLLPKIFGNNNAEQTVKATTQQVTTEIPTTAEPTTVEPTTDIPTTAKSTTIEPTTAKPTEPETSKDYGESTQKVVEDAILTAFQLKFPRIIHTRLMVIRLLFMNRIITNILKQARTDFYSLLTGHMTERSA